MMVGDRRPVVSLVFTSAPPQKQTKKKLLLCLMSLGCVMASMCLYCPVLWGETIAMDSESRGGGGAPSLDQPVFLFSECGCA